MLKRVNWSAELYFSEHLLHSSWSSEGVYPPQTKIFTFLAAYFSYTNTVCRKHRLMFVRFYEYVSVWVCLWVWGCLLQRAVYAIVPDPWFGLALHHHRQCWLSQYTMVTGAAPMWICQNGALSSKSTKKDKCKSMQWCQTQVWLGSQGNIGYFSDLLLEAGTASDCFQLPWRKQHFWYQYQPKLTL